MNGFFNFPINQRNILNLPFFLLDLELFFVISHVIS